MAKAIVNINDNYRFTVDEMNFTLEQKGFNKKKEIETWTPKGYYTDLTVMFRRIRHLETVNKAAEKDEVPLKEYIEIMANMDKELREILNRCMREI